MFKIPSNRLGFTLIELMIVITIIAVLMAILLPNLTRSRQQAILSSCESNERNLVAALEVYNTQYKRYPLQTNVLFPDYIKPMPTCPTNKSVYGYEVDETGKTFTVYCNGTHYNGVMDMTAGYPKYTPTSGLHVRPQTTGAGGN